MAHRERTLLEDVAYLRGMARLSRGRGFGALGRGFAFEADQLERLGPGWRVVELKPRAVAPVVPQGIPMQRAVA